MIFLLRKLQGFSSFGNYYIAKKNLFISVLFSLRHSLRHFALNVARWSEKKGFSTIANFVNLSLKPELE